MLSTLSFNANGEVIGGSTKFKLPHGSTHHPCQEESILKSKAPEASSPYDDFSMAILKGDLQSLEARSAECRYLLSSKLKWPF